MNKYLIKIAEQQEKQPGPLHVAAQESAASIVPDLAGAAAGNIAGKKLRVHSVKFLGGEHNLGGMAGAMIGGLAANYGVLKYHQLKNKGNQNG